jgi:hypothetical protein
VKNEARMIRGKATLSHAEDKFEKMLEGLMGIKNGKRNARCRDFIIF